MEGAAWWGGSAMLVAFTSVEAAAAASPCIRLLCNLLATIALCVLLVAVLWGLDVATASSSARHGSLLLRMGGCFALVASAVAALQRMSQSYYWYTFAALQAVVFISLSVHLAAAPAGAYLLLAGGMSALACALITLCDPSPKYAEAK